MRWKRLAFPLAAGAAVLLAYRLRPKRYIPDELYNLFWDDVNKRWRTDEEVRDILEKHPERVPVTLLESEARILGYLTEIEAAGKSFDLDPALIAAVISKESGGDWDAVGDQDTRYPSYGLMQIRLTTAEMLGYTGDATDLLNPSVNVRYGSEYLRWQMDRYDGNVETAIAAYNTGTAYLKGDRFKNQGYVDDVLRRWERFKVLIARAKGDYARPLGFMPERPRWGYRYNVARYQAGLDPAGACPTPPRGEWLREGTRWRF